ncbi:MAG: hypothetical protein ACI8RD_000879 [Bacillariaceae sp.]|jgi:hypothetical protein
MHTNNNIHNIYSNNVSTSVNIYTLYREEGVEIRSSAVCGNSTE